MPERDAATPGASDAYLLTRPVLEGLDFGLLNRAQELYDATCDQWQPGTGVACAEWSRLFGAIAATVRRRGDMLEAEGEFSAADREEYLANAAVLRGALFGWCLRLAAAESILTGVAGGVVLDAVQAATVRDALENSRRVCAQSLSEREGEAVTCPCIIAAECLKLAALRAVGVEPEVPHAP